MLTNARVIDLSQPLGPSTVHWPGTFSPEATTMATHAESGYYARAVRFFEHSGTHLDAPAHFSDGGAMVHEIPADLLVRPVAVLDVRDRVGDDPDWRLSAADVTELEARDGKIAAGSAVLVATGWDRFLADGERYVGTVEGGTSFPGVGLDAARLLVGERGVVGIGIDTLGIDPGNETAFPVHYYTLPAGIWHLEGLVGVERVPPRGAWLIVGAPLLHEGSGVPSRVLALVWGQAETDG
jgi:kynurenine formamidase